MMRSAEAERAANEQTSTPGACGTEYNDVLTVKHVQTGDVFEVSLDLQTTTLGKLRRLLAQEQNLGGSAVRLVHRGRALEGRSTALLASMGVESGNTLTLFCRTKPRPAADGGTVLAAARNTSFAVDGQRLQPPGSLRMHIAVQGAAPCKVYMDPSIALDAFHSLVWRWLERRARTSGGLHVAQGPSIEDDTTPPPQSKEHVGQRRSSGDESTPRHAPSSSERRTTPSYGLALRALMLPSGGQSSAARQPRGSANEDTAVPQLSEAALADAEQSDHEAALQIGTVDARGEDKAAIAADSSPLRSRRAFSTSAAAGGRRAARAAAAVFGAADLPSAAELVLTVRGEALFPNATKQLGEYVRDGDTVVVHLSRQREVLTTDGTCAPSSASARAPESPREGSVPRAPSLAALAQLVRVADLTNTAVWDVYLPSRARVRDLHRQLWERCGIAPSRQLIVRRGGGGRRREALVDDNAVLQDTVGRQDPLKPPLLAMQYRPSARIEALVPAVGTASAPGARDAAAELMLLAIDRGFDSARVPALIDCCEGGTYVLVDDTGAATAVMKPADEEPGAPHNPRERLGVGLGAPSPLRPSIRIGDGALNEVAAYILDRGGFAGVPCTCLARVACPSGSASEVWEAGSSVGQQAKLCSIQRYVRHMCTAEDFGPRMFAREQIHRIGVLDLRIVNQDRHLSNLLVCNVPRRRAPPSAAGAAGAGSPRTARAHTAYRSHANADSGGEESEPTPTATPTQTKPINIRQPALGQHSPPSHGRSLPRGSPPAVQRIPVDAAAVVAAGASPGGAMATVHLAPASSATEEERGGRAERELILIPIDHAFSLPRYDSIGCPFFEWLTWPQTREPFSEETLEYIASLDGAADARILRTRLGMPEEVARTVEITTAVLQVGAARGATLYDMAKFMSRRDLYSHEKSELERCIDSCRFVAVGRSSALFAASSDDDDDDVNESSHRGRGSASARARSATDNIAWEEQEPASPRTTKRAASDDESDAARSGDYWEEFMRVLREDLEDHFAGQASFGGQSDAQNKTDLMLH